MYVYVCGYVYMYEYANVYVYVYVYICVYVCCFDNSGLRVVAQLVTRVRLRAFLCCWLLRDEFVARMLMQVSIQSLRCLFAGH